MIVKKKFAVPVVAAIMNNMQLSGSLVEAGYVPTYRLKNYELKN